MLSAGAIAGVIGGAIVGLGGVIMRRWGRTRISAPGATGDAPPQGVLETLLGYLSVPSRYVIGFCLMVLGYHLVSYSLPGRMLWLRVPPDRLWILGVAMAVVVGGSLAMDVAHRR